ncbi:MAG: hypothetical protein D6B26_02015 [Spirochaetaceae bacterium]|nr:MAG: hypothetical protein D6B26_02015 [Spirochaetaceae bacterium]
MTLRTRRITIFGIILLNLTLLTISMTTLTALAARLVKTPLQLFSGVLVMLNSNPGLGYSLGASIIGTLLLVILSRYFRRNPSPETFLTMAAIGAIAVETIRTGFIILTIAKAPIIYYELLARIIIFSQLFSITGLFFSSLYLLDIQYQKVNYIVLIQLITALLFAYILPVHTAHPVTLLQHPVADSFGYPWLVGGIYACSILNIMAVWGQQKNLENWPLYSGAAMLSTGYILHIILNGNWRLVGLSLLTIGAILFFWGQNKRYLWD